MKVVVIGGTGLIGSHVVRGLRDHGVEVDVGSLRTGVDAYSGRGLPQVVAGARVVVDATNMNRPSYEYEQSHEFFTTCTRNILAAGRDAGVDHHVAISMIGAGSIDSEFFRGKVAQEQLVLGSVTPHTLLRTTMLHEVVPRLVDHVATTHMVRLPPVRVQPVAARDVADQVVRLALGTPRDGTFEIAGPETYFLDELARRVLAEDGDDRRVVPDHTAYYLGAQLEPGTEALLPSWRTTSAAFEVTRPMHLTTHQSTDT